MNLSESHVINLNLQIWIQEHLLLSVSNDVREPFLDQQYFGYSDVWFHQRFQMFLIDLFH